MDAAVVLQQRLFAESPSTANAALLYELRPDVQSILIRRARCRRHRVVQTNPLGEPEDIEVHSVFTCLVLLAQQGRYDRGLLIFKWGITGVGIVILFAAACILLSKSKKASKDMSPMVKRIAAAILGALGLGVIGYAWLVF